MLSNNGKLNKEEFMPYAPDVPGDQVHVHHCKLGHNNDRMYVTRNSDNSVMAYCHHCGKKGFYADDSFVRNIHSKTRNSKEKAISLPKTISTRIVEWDKETKLKLLSYGISLDEIRKYNIMYDTANADVYFPVLDNINNFIGYIKRNYVNEYSSKYIKNYDINKYCPMIFKVDNKVNTETLVIVEDYISAIRCSRYVDTLVLLGTNLTDRGKLEVLRQEYKKVVVFLDNDNNIVKSKYLPIKQYFDTVLEYGASIVRTDKDPKDYEDEELKTLLEEYVNDK